LYIYAAGTGSMIYGALSLFAFGLGTLPVMMGFGAFTSYVSRSTAHSILKASGAIMLLLGLLMLNRGLALTGTGYDLNTFISTLSLNSLTGASVATSPSGFQEIRMNVTRYGWEPDKFVLQKDVPVKWIINGVELNSCNNAIVVPKLGLEFDIKSSEQVIEFTPTEEGVIPWSCWMGMIQGVFVVKNDTNPANTEAELQNIQLPNTGGTCGCGGRF